MKKRVISIVVVNFNGKAWLQACLESVFSQQLESGFSMQVILVDNNSTDGSAAFVEATYPDAIVIQLDHNLGFGSGCNIAVQSFESEYVLFLNNDTILPKDTLSGLVKDLEQRGLDAVAANEVPYAGGEPRLKRTTIDYLGFPVYLFEGDRFAKGDSFYLVAACLLVKRSTFLVTDGFDPSFFMYFEDTDWFWRLRLLGYKFDYAEKSVVRHAGQGSTGGSTLNYDRFVWRNVNLPKMLFKNLGFQNLFWVLPLYFASCIIEYSILILMGRQNLARSYITSLPILLRDFRTVRVNRKRIQRSRVIGDIAIFKTMYPGFGKIKALKNRFTSTN